MEYVRENENHPSAQAIYEAVKKQHPGVSFGTIYRNLNILADQGEMERLEFFRGKSHFDANRHLHYHFVCKVCGNIIDLSISVETSLNDQVKTATGHRVDRHQIEFFGTCKDCLASPGRESSNS